MQEDEQDYEEESPPEVTSPTAFSTIPRWLFRTKISDRAFKIYCILAQMQGSRGKESHPSRNTLVRMTESSTNSVARALKELCDIGAIQIIERFRADGGRASSSYIIYYSHPAYEQAPGMWTDGAIEHEDVMCDGTPRPSTAHPLGHPRPTPWATGGLPKKNNHIEEQPKEKKVASPSARSTQPRSLPEKDIASLKEKWAHRWSSPVIERHIENALNHTASRKAIDLKRYVDNWLRNQEKYDWPKGATPVRPIPLATAKVAPTDWDEADG